MTGDKPNKCYQKGSQKNTLLITLRSRIQGQK